MRFTAWGSGAPPLDAGGRERTRLESRAAEGESPVREAPPPHRGTPSRPGHVKPRPNPWSPFHKARYRRRPIAHKYREGKVKRTLLKGVKRP